jgi:cell division protein FtsW (lipid II flippase)
VRRRSRHGAVLDHLEHDERHRDRYLLDPVQVRLLVLDRVLHLHDLHDPAATIVEHVHTHPLGDEPMSAITSLRPRRGRNVELLLLLFAVGIVVLAYVSVEAAVHDAVPAGLLTQAGGLLAIAIAFHLVLRFRVSYADPLLLPIATLLNGLGLVMVHRIELARPETSATAGMAMRQLTWSALAVVMAVVVLLWLRDHRMLRRYTYLTGAAGLALLLLPRAPGIGRELNGARIWIGIGPFSFQPGEIAKLMLAIFFAGYLVQTRDALSIAGRKILGFTMPRGRDLGPILLMWLLSLAVLASQKDLGSALLFFGLFVAMLYVATERTSWIAIGLLLAAAGAYAAYHAFAHVQERVTLWLHPFSAEAKDISTQLATGLMGMASGGMLGNGLGQGRPDLTPWAESDFIVASFGEEVGLIGLVAILMLYVLLVERGFRTAIGVRDGFGKLLAAGLSFSIALQCFVVVGGVTRVIPLTGLTMPFLSQGGSSLLANWTLIALLLRISDQARQPVIEDATTGSLPAVVR